jgi:large subunit ribosomal protein L21
MTYAIIRVGNKQHRVRDGETLVVDRVHTDEGGTFKPDVLLGDGIDVTVKVLAHERGPKIRIGKYRKRTGYKRHNGFRAATTRIEVSLATAKTAPAKRAAPAPKAERAEKAPAETETPKHEAAPKGMPAGYDKLTVAEIAAGARTWRRPQLEAALAYEQEHGKRKGALTALESALAAKEER